MRLALDTNRYVDLCKGVEGTVRLVATAESVSLPFVVLAELRAGFALGKRTADNERVLRRFLLKPRRRRFSMRTNKRRTTTRRRFASCAFRARRSRQRPVDRRLVLQRNLTLHARDRHFDHLPQIVRA